MYQGIGLREVAARVKAAVEAAGCCDPGRPSSTGAENDGAGGDRLTD